MADLLRGTAAFPEFSKALRVSMVEVSPHLRRMQWDALRCQGTPPDAAAATATAVPDSSSSPGAGGSGGTSSSGSLSAVSSSSSSNVLADSSSSSSSSTSDAQRESGTAPPPAVRGVSGWNGGVVSWHRSLEEVDGEDGEGEEGGCPALYIAHEFLDALPVHQFQKTGGLSWWAQLVGSAGGFRGGGSGWLAG
jgi:NADH dehydrogenase [ubiquinone] 1 alpha subcomplex assembly factor 7